MPFSTVFAAQFVMRSSARFAGYFLPRKFAQTVRPIKEMAGEKQRSKPAAPEPRHCIPQAQQPGLPPFWGYRPSPRILVTQICCSSPGAGRGVCVTTVFCHSLCQLQPAIRTPRLCDNNNCINPLLEQALATGLHRNRLPPPPATARGSQACC